MRGTKEDARKELTRREAAVVEGRSSHTKETLHGYLQRWLEGHASKIRVNTLNGYKLSLKRLVGVLPDARLDALQPVQIERGYAALSSQGLAPQTVLHAHHLLQNALGAAVRLGLLHANPCDRVLAPKTVRQPTRAMTIEQATQVISCADERYQPVLTFLLHTGCRRSEACALLWEDVDLEAGVARITASVDNIEGLMREAVRSATKTAGSNRTVQLGAKLVEVLVEWRSQLRRQANFLPWGHERLASPYVFPGEKGGICHPDRVTLAWSRAAKRAGVSARLHDLRHTHASLLLMMGVEVPVVSARLGHSSSAVTLDVYSHVISGRERTAVDKFDQLVTSGDKPVTNIKTKRLAHES